MPSRQRRSITLGGEHYDIWFTNEEPTGWRQIEPADHPDEWQVDLTPVTRMLTAIETGEITAAQARDALLGAATFASGCCWRCDQATPFFEEAVRRGDERLAEWRERMGEITPETHPYVIGGTGKIHRNGCTNATRAAVNAPHHPGSTLHEFAVLFDGLGGASFGLEHFELQLASMEPITPRLATAAEVADKMSRWKKDRRCKLCQPELPGALLPETSGHPGAGV